MVKRRHILLGGVATGIVATVGKDYQVYRKKEQLFQLAKEQQPENTQELLKAAFEADADKIYQGQSILKSLQLNPSKLPYDADLSKRLIRFSKIATQQYLTGKTIPTYKGNIAELPAYNQSFNNYQQIAAFQGQEAEIIDPIDVQLTPREKMELDPLGKSLDEAESQVGEAITTVVKIKKEVPVYYGFVLSSATENIIVFRGTQTNVEWLNNLTAIQKDYTDPISGKYCGKIHEGFIKNYLRIINPLPRDLAKNLDPKLPCYITGHSLGASVAILAALDIALNVPQLAPQIRLYTYASPRVGDATFATVHSQTIPNSYRVINLADVIPLLPPTKLGKTIYVHVGEAWSFLSQGDDFMPNHVVDTYEAAVNAGVETNQMRQFPTSGLS
jgi:triacylglycerol lipase